jgi:hypothetical protein
MARAAWMEGRYGDSVAFVASTSSILSIAGRTLAMFEADLENERVASLNTWNTYEMSILGGLKTETRLYLEYLRELRCHNPFFLTHFVLPEFKFAYRHQVIDSHVILNSKSKHVIR